MQRERLPPRRSPPAALFAAVQNFPFFRERNAHFAQPEQGALGKLLEIHSGFHHGSDLDPNKPVNWKRQVKTCGEIGVMGDLGMHTVHVPFRLGWNPVRVYAQLQKIYHKRPDGEGRHGALRHLG